ncbi:MAG TPA: sugar-binding domain-containing protein [Halanaerobiales bacterium]|nr:sugar-binding domain-containing protein [Halanaerobiales bacterium]
MNYLLKIQKKLVPELISIAEIRYNILKEVFNHQPIGRRNLARKLDLSIRNVRKHLDFLYEKRYIKITKSGTILTENGEDFLHELDTYMKEIKDIANIENEIEKLLGIDKVMIVPVEKDSEIINKEIGRFTARFLKEMINDQDIIAVTGGSTLAQVAETMVFLEEPKDVTVIPGRGGLGENVEIQANTIASKIAKKLGGQYKLLHIPDDITRESLAMITNEPSVKKTLDELQKANILVHGIGTAEMMSARRDMEEAEIEKLKDKGAIAEAFGLYFNEEGEVVYSTASVGLSMADLKNIDKVIAVAGGVDKARAIISVVSPEYHDILITDELTAREIKALKGGEKEQKLNK